MADKIEDPICGKKITVMIFANGSMNFLGGRSRQAIHDAYDTMTRKQEPLGFLREFAIGISDVPPTPRSSSSSGSMLPLATSLAAAAPQTPLSKEEVVDEAIDAAEDAVDDGDEEESKTLSVGVRKNLRRDLLKCFSDGDDEGDAKPWPLIEAKLRAYVTDKKKSLKSTEMAAVLAGSLKRLLPRRDDDAAAAAAAQREAQAAAAKAAVNSTDEATAGEARPPAMSAAASLGAGSPQSPAVVVASDDARSFAVAGVKRKADEAQLDSPGHPAAENSPDAIAEIENAASSAADAIAETEIAASSAADGIAGIENAAAGSLNSSRSGGESEPQPVQLGAGQAVKFGFGRKAIRGVGAAKKRTRGKVFGFAGGDDDDD